MKNELDFDKRMETLDDKSLIKIFTIDRHKYIESAINAAQKEIITRQLNIEEILVEINNEESETPEGNYNLKDLKYIGLLIAPFAITSIGLLEIGDLFLVPFLSTIIFPFSVFVVMKVNKRIKSFENGIAGINNILLTLTLILAYLTSFVGFIILWGMIAMIIAF